MYTFFRLDGLQSGLIFMFEHAAKRTVIHKLNKKNTKFFMFVFWLKFIN